MVTVNKCYIKRFYKFVSYLQKAWRLCETMRLHMKSLMQCKSV